MIYVEKVTAFKITDPKGKSVYVKSLAKNIASINEVLADEEWWKNDYAALHLTDDSDGTTLNFNREQAEELVSQMWGLL